LVNANSVFTEARLSDNGHPRISRDPLELHCEVSEAQFMHFANYNAHISLYIPEIIFFDMLLQSETSNCPRLYFNSGVKLKGPEEGN
jgi:hypothetical protein